MYRRLLSFLRPHWWRMAGSIGCNLAAAVLDIFSITLLIPFLTTLFGVARQASPLDALQNRLIGAFLDPADPMGSLTSLLLIILLAVIAKNTLVWLSGQLGASLQEYVTRDLRNALYAHLQRLPLRYFTRMRTGQILSRVLNDTGQTKLVITEVVTRSVQSAAMVVTAVIALFALSWRLALIALVVAPLLIALLQPLLRKLRQGHRRLSTQYGEMTAVVQEAVSGIRLVKSFRGEAYENDRFQEASGRYSRGMMKMTRISFLAPPITETVGTAIAVVILALGAREVLVTRTMSGPMLITFLGLVLRMLQPLKQLSQVPTIAQQSFAAAERLFDVFDEPTELSTDRGTRSLPALKQNIRFERVSFSYDDEPVLEEISFEARCGDVIALVGPSGAGKSTLVDLIPRFIEPSAGRILFDGIDARDIRLDALRALTGIVNQDTVIFNDTVRHNIAYAAKAAYPEERIVAAAIAANAHEFISELPDGYDTVLGERGTRLSGGQRQRIAIARALLVDPPLLILDEATSALDTESERLVQEAVDHLLTGRTVFVIAHRLSTIMHATQILVLDRGRIVDRGTHDELLARGGLYGRLHALQFGHREVAVGAGN
jgi:subfamily B ATP-binding cassette protein MsbA